MFQLGTALILCPVRAGVVPLRIDIPP
jgi:hypothetical protein